ncbi:MAG TPA: hypothetical protein VFS11_03945 [Gemmatimonadales bacterium]|nr:hypothetical protein [Gemmatimonadales bacterium]
MHDTDPIDDTPLPPELLDAARAYHAPPPTPREVMWRAVQAEREATQAAEPAGPRPRAGRYVRWALAASVLLAVGVGLGRLTLDGPRAQGANPMPPSPAPVARGSSAPAREPEAYRVAATEHLAQAEEFLTLFRTSVRGQDQQRLASVTARQLLASNRLLLDSPAGADPRLKLLLQDLELVLAQIAQLSPQRGREDLHFITDGLERGGVLPRLRAAVPAGGPYSLRQGAL